LIPEVLLILNVGNNVGESRLTRINELLIKDNKKSAKDLANQLNVSERTIERDIEKLKNSGNLKRIGSDNDGYWKVIK